MGVMNVAPFVELRQQRKIRGIWTLIDIYDRISGPLQCKDPITYIVAEKFINTCLSAYMDYYNVTADRPDQFSLFYKKMCWLYYRCIKYVPKIFWFSPLPFLFFDCIFNQFIINHFICWLAIYIPMVQFYRLTYFNISHTPSFTEMLYEMYYGESNPQPKNFFFYFMCECEPMRPLFDHYLLTYGASTRDVWKKYKIIDYDFCFIMRAYIRFTIDHLDTDTTNLFYNNVGIILKREANGKFIQIEPQDRIEEWTYLGGDLIAYQNYIQKIKRS